MRAEISTRVRERCPPRHWWGAKAKLVAFLAVLYAVLGEVAVATAVLFALIRYALRDADSGKYVSRPPSAPSRSRIPESQRPIIYHEFDDEEWP